MLLPSSPSPRSLLPRVADHHAGRPPAAGRGDLVGGGAGAAQLGGQPHAPAVPGRPLSQPGGASSGLDTPGGPPTAVPARTLGWPFVRRWWGPLLAVACALIVIVSTRLSWSWLTASGEDTRILALRLSSLVAASLVAIVLAIWRSIVAQQQLETAQQLSKTALRQSETALRRSETAQGQFKIAQRARLEERFQPAAEILGNNELPIRLAGIHALNQLGRDYPKELHIQVMQLFAAFVRHPINLNRVPKSGSPRKDVQHIMVHLGERTKRQQKVERDRDFILDLSGADLGLVWFPTDACLARMRLSGARLCDAKGLTQHQLDAAIADPKDPPELENCIDRETGEPLVWNLQPKR